MKVIELCGNPGCGKTTIGKEVLNCLRKQGYNAYDYNEIKEKKSLKNIRYLYGVNSWILLSRLIKFGLKNGLNKKLLIYSIKITLLINYIKDNLNNKKIDYLLFDEGIIQYITTLSHNRTIGEEINPLSKMIRDNYNNNDYYVFSCILDIEENVKRINTRNRQGDRFVVDNIMKQKELLIKKNNNINFVLTKIKPKKMYCLNSNDLYNAKNYIIEVISKDGENEKIYKK